MSRSRKVRQDFLETVKLALKRNGFLSQQALAEELDMSRSTVVNFLTGKSVDLAYFDEICSRLSLDMEEIAAKDFEIPLQTSVSETIASTSINHQDWGEAPDGSIFYGREAELIDLKQWVIQEQCRVVCVLGMGGMGKTTLSIQLAKQIQSEFAYVIWRSLRNAPPLESILTELIQFFSDQESVQLSRNSTDKTALLFNILQQHRCLVVLDNCESILQEGSHAGHYRKGYEGYGNLFKSIGEISHQSCLLLTSRERPSEIAQLESSPYVKSIRLNGVSELDGLKIFENKKYSSCESELKLIIGKYGGNPLALKLIAGTIEELFDNNITEFTQQGINAFGDIWKLLSEQFNRLSDLEMQIMYWLVIEREWTSIEQLRQDLIPPPTSRQLLESLESLQRRYLIEGQSARFTQQPVVMEFVSSLLVEQLCHELESETIGLLDRVAIIQSQAKDYIRETQVRLFLQPIVSQLLAALKRSGIQVQISKILNLIHLEPLDFTGYLVGNLINLLSFMGVDLTGYNFSGLTIRQAYLKGNNFCSVNFSKSDFINVVFAEKFGGILGVAFSPDGNKIASSSTDGEIRLWQVATGQQLLQWKAHSNWVRSIAFSPDGKTIGSGSADCSVKIWDTETAECLHHCLGHSSRVWSVVFSPNGELLASSSDDQTIRFWKVSTGEYLQSLIGHTGRIRAIAFSSDGHNLVSASDDQTIRIWDVTTGGILRLYGLTIRSIVGMSETDLFASSDADRILKVWKFTTGDSILTLEGHQDEIWTVVVNLSGTTIASGSNDKTIKIWNVATGECSKTLYGHSKDVLSIDFSPNEEMLVSGSNDQTIRLWDVQTGQCIRTLQGYTSGIYSVAYSPDSAALVASGADNLIRIWKVETGECKRVLSGHKSPVRSVIYSPDGQILASGSEDHTIKLWDVNTGKCLKTIEGHSNWVWSVSFSFDGKYLVSCSDDLTVKLWDAKTGSCLKIIEGHTNWVWSVSFSPNSKYLASSSSDATIRLWDVESGQCLNTLQGHINGVRKVAFAPDGQTIASASEDKTIKIWDVKSGQCLATFQGHSDWVWSVNFSPDGKILVSSGNDQTIRLWDLLTCQCLKVLQGHTNWVYAVNFSPDGHLLISVSEDETTRLWDIASGLCIKSFISPRLYEGMDITDAKGLTEAQRITLKNLGAIV